MTKTTTSLSRIGSGLYMAQTSKRQYLVGGTRNAWTVIATNLNEDGSPDASTTTEIAKDVSLTTAEQAISNHSRN